MNAKTAFIAAILAATAALSAPTTDARALRIATEGAFAPWNFTDPSGKLVGFEVDLAHDLCARLGATGCEVVGQAWDGLIPALQQGRYDAIMAGMSITAEREKVIAFAGPYATEPTAFAAATGGVNLDIGPATVDLSGDPAKAKEVLAKMSAALKGKTVGVQTSTIQADFMEQLLPEVTLRRYDTLEAAALDLASGRLDALLGARSAVDAVVKGRAVYITGPAFSRGLLGRGVGVGVRRDDAALRAELDAAIVAATLDGT